MLNNKNSHQSQHFGNLGETGNFIYSSVYSAMEEVKVSCNGFQSLETYNTDKVECNSHASC